jgi:hypothetical protein
MLCMLDRNDVLVPGLLMVDRSSDFSCLGDRQVANEFRIAQME